MPVQLQSSGATTVVRTVHCYVTHAGNRVLLHDTRGQSGRVLYCTVMWHARVIGLVNDTERQVKREESAPWFQEWIDRRGPAMAFMDHPKRAVINQVTWCRTRSKMRLTSKSSANTGSIQCKELISDLFVECIFQKSFDQATERLPKNQTSFTSHVFHDDTKWGFFFKNWREDMCQTFLTCYHTRRLCSIAMGLCKARCNCQKFNWSGSARFPSLALSQLPLSKPRFSKCASLQGLAREGIWNDF